MRINLRQIEVFRAVMLTKSISGAAQLLHVSQPAVSRLMSYTEGRLGRVLFERIKGRIYPTPEAQKLFAEIESVYQGVQRVNDLASDLLEKRTGTLRICCSPSISQTLMPKVIDSFGHQYPDVRIHLDTLIAAGLIEMVVTQQAEIGITVAPVDHPNLESRKLYESYMLVALPSTHRLANKQILHVSDLVGERLIGYGGDTPLGQLLSSTFAASNIQLRPTIEVRHTHTACAMVQAGAGIAIVDGLSAIGRSWPDVVVRPLDPSPKVVVSVVYSRFSPLSALAREFVKMVAEVQYPNLYVIPKAVDNT